MPHGKLLFFEIEYVNGQVEKLKAPLLLPPFDLIKRVRVSKVNESVKD